MERWYTKEDVMKDLALANGLQENFEDESFIISGARPPPPPRHLIDEDDEMEQYLRYGIFGGRDQHSRIRKPDLEGISKMLRMVNEPQEKTVEAKKPEETSIIISKLNPHVSEFVPKQVMNTKSTNGMITNLKDVSEEHHNCEKEEFLIKKLADSNKGTNKLDFLKLNPDGEKTIQMKQKSCDQNDDDIKSENSNLEAILKEKIIGSAKAKSIKEKTVRNVAIAALLKLKSGPPQSPSITSSSDSKTATSDSPANKGSPKEALVLHPPYFYESKCIEAQTDNIISVPHSTEPANSSNEKDSEQAITSNLESADGATAEVNPEEQESIQKVMNWLNQPEKKKPLEPPHIGPINFKKRDPAPLSCPIVYKKKETKESSNSPVSDSAAKKPSQPGAFVPSKYADDLAKKYEERVKANEDRQLDIWSKLERDLKARDEVVKERLKAQNGSSPNASRGSSRCSNRRQ